MAQYMILIYGEETDYSTTSPEEWAESMGLHNQFAEQVVQQGGKIISGEALELSSTATSILSLIHI